MEIFFKNKKMQKIFNDEKLLRKHFNKIADKIMLWMEVLVSAENLEQVPKLKPERCHELKGDRKGQFAVDLTSNYRLVFEPIEKFYKLDGGLDLSRITAIKIISVEDYHE